MSWDAQDPEGHNQAGVECDGCGHRFAVPKSMKGGLVNCPACQKIVEVTQGAEPAFWLLVALGVVIGLAITGVAAAAGGPVAGLIAFVICTGILMLTFLAL